jgi:hypothetical protein
VQERVQVRSLPVPCEALLEDLNSAAFTLTKLLDTLGESRRSRHRSIIHERRHRKAALKFSGRSR